MLVCVRMCIRCVCWGGGCWVCVLGGILAGWAACPTPCSILLLQMLSIWTRDSPRRWALIDCVSAQWLCNLRAYDP